MLTFYVAPTLGKANDMVLDTIAKRRDRKSRVLVLTPDRINFDMQSKIFDVLGEKSLFDVEVNTLTRIVHKYLDHHGRSGDVLTKQAGVSVVKKIILDHKDQLESFSKSSRYDGFASVLYEMICLLKSCNITPSMVVEPTKRTMLTKKLKDIAFVYEQYEEFLSHDFTDSFNRLDLYCSLLTKEDFDGVEVLFVGFEDVTKKMMDIILKMSRLTQVGFACAYQKKDNAANYMMYRTAPFLSMVDYATTQGVAYEIENGVGYDADYTFLSSHLFGVSNQKHALVDSKYHIWQADNKKDEVAYLMRRIGYDVVSGHSTYDDHTIVVASYHTYRTLLKEEALLCNVPLYLDESDSFVDHGYVRVLFALLEFLQHPHHAKEFITLAKQDLFGLSRDLVEYFEQKIQYLGYAQITPKVLELCGEQDGSRQLIAFYEMLQNCAKQFLESVTIGEKISITKQLFETIGYAEYLEKQVVIHGQAGAYELSRTTAQLLKKWDTLLVEVDKVLGGHACTMEEYVAILRSTAKDITISLPPVTHHSVKVLDMTKSQITESKYVYFVGCNAGHFPTTLADNGIVTDEEMLQLSYAKQLSPTIAELNDRAKRKLLDALLVGKEVVLSFASSDDQGNTCMPATVVDQLNIMLGVALMPISSSLDLLSNVMLQDKALMELQSFSYPLIKDRYARLVHNVQAEEVVTHLSSIAQLCDKDYLARCYDPYDRQKLDNCQHLFFPKGHTSVSQLEKFYACPYQHFMQYGLRVKPAQDSRMESNHFGDILHMFCMRFVQYLQNNKADNTALDKVSIILHTILQQPEYERFLRDESNYYAIQGLYEEVKRIGKAILEERQHSCYVPVVLEGGFGTGGIELWHEGQKISLVGKIDRIDGYQNFFRVIDYKTGADSFSYTDVASGKKLQLLIYVMAYANQSHKTPVSAVYLPIRNQFQKEENVGYRFDGVIPNTLEQLQAMDDRLKEGGYTSNVIKVATNDQAAIARKNDLMIDSDDLAKLTDFAFGMAQKAFASIMEGNITPYPMQNGDKLVCDYCPYLAMCKFHQGKGDAKRMIEKKTFAQLFAKEDEDGTHN